MGDGGKVRYDPRFAEADIEAICQLTCGLERIQQQRGKKCVVYSFGVNFESSWEVELLERTDCEIWGFDFSVEKWGPQMLEQPYDITKRAHFYKWGVGGVDEVKDGNQFYKLSTLMKMFGHEWIDIREFPSCRLLLFRLADALPCSQLKWTLRALSLRSCRTSSTTLVLANCLVSSDCISSDLV